MRHTVKKEAYSESEVRSTVGLRARDINGYHVVYEFLQALIAGNSQKALDISKANPDLQPYFNWAIAQYATHGQNATLA